MPRRLRGAHAAPGGVLDRPGTPGGLAGHHLAHQDPATKIHPKTLAIFGSLLLHNWIKF